PVPWRRTVMARVCERCQYYSPGNDELTCPECRIPLRFTLLGVEEATGGAPAAPFMTPRGGARLAAAEAPPEAPPELTPRKVLPNRALLRGTNAAHGGDGRRKLLLLAALAAVGLALGGLGVAGLDRGIPLAERYERIEVGMDEDEAIDLLDSGGLLATLTREFVEIPSDDDNRYTWVWQERGVRITLEIADGKVVSKSEEGLPPPSEPKGEPEEDPDPE